MLENFQQKGEVGRQYAVIRNVNRRGEIAPSRQWLHGERETRASFILKVKKENLLKAEDNISEEQGVEDTEKEYVLDPSSPRRTEGWY